MVTFRVGNSSLSKRDVCDIIDVNILRFMREDFPGLVGSIRGDLIFVMDECLRVLWANLGVVQMMNREVSFMEFDTYGAPHFIGGKEPIISRRWIANVESAFCASFCLAEAKVIFATYIQCDEL